MGIEQVNMQRGRTLDEGLMRRVFLPTLDGAVDRIDRHQLKLAHYTSFEVAKLIITNHAVWMRNARMMNDVGEIEYGLAATDAVMADPAVKDRIREVLNPFNTVLAPQFESYWAHMRNNVANEVYISCFSEHWPEEDPLGRLSMWRAYCAKPDGVAIVLNTEPFRLKSNALNAYSSPVYYGRVVDFKARFLQMLGNVDREHVAVSTLGHEAILSSLLMALLFGTVCLKHPGFAEEKEWRVVHMPNIRIPSLLRRTDVAGPPPQTVYEILLQDAPDQGLIGLEPDALVDKIIIGPSNRAGLIRQELEELMTVAGMKGAAARIVDSGMPLRVAT
jgi:hypothetical protein